MKQEEIIWSACKVDSNLFNLTLVLIPELDCFDMNGIEGINKITLTSGKNIHNEYELGHYLVEGKETNCFIS